MRRMLLVVTALACLAADAGSDAATTTCAVDGDCEAGTKCDTAHAKCVTPDPDLADNSSTGGCGCRFGPRR